MDCNESLLSFQTIPKRGEAEKYSISDTQTIPKVITLGKTARKTQTQFIDSKV